MIKPLFILVSMLSMLFAETLSLTTVLPTKTRQFVVDPNTQIYVAINPKALKKSQTLSIDLPEDFSATFENSHFIYRKDGDFSWVGKPVNGAIDDQSLFTTKDGATYGVIVFNKNKYIMQKKSDGTYKIYKEKKVPKNCGNDLIKFPEREIQDPLPLKQNQNQNSTIFKSSSSLSPVPLRSNKLRTANSIINVMVLYTQAFADEFVGTLSAKIQLSIDYANTAMSNSGIALTYNLAHQELYENVHSNESVSIADALYHITGIVDGVIDISGNEVVRRLRAAYNIDETTLFRSNPPPLDPAGEVIGLGWVPSSSSRTTIQRTSYNVSEYSDETFAHESGHNFGCAHSRDIDNCSGALFDYACGFDNGDFGTVMSYNLNLVIPYFSNPNMIYESTAIGDTQTDCSRSIEETKQIMARNDDITEVNENDDTINSYAISGNINDPSIDDPSEDRDWYQIGLGGETNIQMSSIYSNIGFYVNLYDEDGFLIRSFITTDESVTLDNGIYNLVISNEDDTNGNYWFETKAYNVTLTSNYVGPTPPTQNPLVPLINYLLF